METATALQVTPKLCKCPFCDEKFTWAELHKHKKQAHGHIRVYKRGANIPLPAQDKLKNIQLEIDAAVRELESERDSVQRRLVELDGTIAGYKKLLINASR